MSLSRTHAGADAVIVNTCGFLDSAKQELLAAIGAALKDNGRVIVTGCMGAEPEAIRDAYPHVAAITGPQDYESVMAAVHRGRAGAAQRLSRPDPGAGRQADAAALRLSQDRRGLRPFLQLLHHPEAAGQARLAPGGRRVARGGEARAGRASRKSSSSRRTPAPTGSTSAMRRANGATGKSPPASSISRANLAS